MARVITNASGEVNIQSTPESSTHDIEISPPPGSVFFMTAGGGIQFTFAKADRRTIEQWLSKFSESISGALTAADANVSTGILTRAELRTLAERSRLEAEALILQASNSVADQERGQELAAEVERQKAADETAEKPADATESEPKAQAKETSEPATGTEQTNASSAQDSDKTAVNSNAPEAPPQVAPKTTP